MCARHFVECWEYKDVQYIVLIITDLWVLWERQIWTQINRQVKFWVLLWKYRVGAPNSALSWGRRQNVPLKRLVTKRTSTRIMENKTSECQIRGPLGNHLTLIYRCSTHWPSFSYLVLGGLGSWNDCWVLEKVSLEWAIVQILFRWL
jgi:hypothetical protein